MSARTTVVLLVLVVAGCLFVVGLEQGWFGKEQQEQGQQINQFLPRDQGQAEDLFEEHPAEVSRLAIVSEDLTATFAKTDEEWEIVEPVKAPAVKWAVDSIVRTISSLQYTRKIPPGSMTDQEMGLDEPTATITIEHEDGQATLRVGGKALLKEHTYVRLDGDSAVYLVTANLEQTLDKQLKDFRKAELVSFKYGEAKAYRIVRRDPPQDLSLIKQDGGDWVIESPIKTRAERGEASDLVTTLTSLRAEEFVDDDPQDLAKYGLDDPYLRITVTLQKEIEAEPESKEEQDESPKEQPTTQPQYETETISLLIGGYVGLQKSRRYAKLGDSPTVVEVNVKTSRLDKLAVDVGSLREVQVPVINTYKMNKFVVIDGQDSVTIERKGREWTITAPQQMEADNAAVNEFVAAIRKLYAADFIDRPDDLARYGLDQPRVQLKLYAPDQVEPDHILIGKLSASGRMLYVQRVGEESIAVVKAAETKKLLVSAVAFGTRQLLRLPEAQVRRLELKRPDGRLVVEKKDWQWRMVKPHDAPADRSSVTSIIGDLASLKARRIVARGRLAEYGLDSPDIILAVELSPPTPPTTTQATQPVREPERHRLLVSKRNDSVYAVLDESDLVYELDPIIYDHLMAELQERRILGFSPAQVENFKISGSDVGEPLEFARADDKWSYVPDEFFPVDSEKVDRRLRELRSLEAQRFVNVAVTNLGQYGLDDPAVRVDLTLQNGDVTSLLVSSRGPEEGNDRYAAVAGEKKVFILTAEQVKKLQPELDGFEKQ